MLAKKMSEYNYKTYTIIGTPHYLAPEVQQGMGYSFPSDYWSLGVIIYEMAIGYLPFADDKEDPYEIFIATQKQKLVFPRSFTNKRMKKLIKLLLCK
jgi:cGMP-dependent protein kinase